MKARDIIRAVPKNKPLFFLKMDFRKFFPSINKEILYKEINRKIKDKHILWLLHQIIPPIGNGLPIGNLTSQLFANVYGTIFDRYIKQFLRVKHYVRYMDDTVIISTDKAYLISTLQKITWFIKNILKLEFSKWYIENIKKGLNFVGYRIFRSHTLIRKSSVVRCKRKIQSYLYHEKYEELYRSLISWSGHIKWSNSYNLGQHIERQIQLWQMN